MTDLTERLRKRIAEASKLPWHLMNKGFGRDNSPTIYGADEDLRFIARFRDGPCFHTATPDLANAKLAVDAVNTLPDLLATLETLTQENARLREALGRVVSVDQERHWTATKENPETHWEIMDGQCARIARKALGGGDE
ncbi:hypothetical protein [Sphingomonas parapaucimobilis]|uniref:Ead/Ea22-like family protein n=1 Tax=Sphingomonas parapaucimobilis NBRC 15100 TaxID=1219049 RepID=A0A0A1W9D4_9SPHN|nr:hypothetical protein [Sphingomonas parapaucimobilis]GAM01721.1 hypothetical protein SP5_068_00890 [Sphingomonas parapaucimobilis NBRC 15100]